MTAPIETWSDDFSIAIAGIPSMVNDFTGGSFMETHYHSQFDNDNFYDKDVYRMHHELFGLLLLAIDRTEIVPLNFARVFEKAKEALDLEWCEELGADGAGLQEDLTRAAETAEKVYAAVERCNRRNAEQIINAGTEQETVAEQATDAGHTADEGARAEQAAPLEQKLLALFAKVQDEFVRIDWYGNVLFPHAVLQQSLDLLTGAADSLRRGDLSAALRKIYEVDNNRYAFMFEEEVYRHFTSYVLEQPKDRLKWGYGRIEGYVNLFGIVKSLLRKKESGEDTETGYGEELAFLDQAVTNQKQLYRRRIGELKEAVRSMEDILEECLALCAG